MRYRVLTPMQLHPGALLGLTAEQAAARAFGLQAEGALWRVVKAVGFKAGEVIEHQGELPKALAAAVEADPSAEQSSPQPAHAAPAAKRVSKRKGE